LAGDLGDHQPVRWRFGWVEDRVGVPDLVDVVDAVAVVFEQVDGLSVDLERIGVVEFLELEQLTHNQKCITNGYEPLGGSFRSSRSGDERGHDVGGVPVEAAPCAVVAHRRAEVGVAGGFLNVAQRKRRRRGRQ
jgi:hypothetical protein